MNNRLTACGDSPSRSFSLSPSLSPSLSLSLSLMTSMWPCVCSHWLSPHPSPLTLGCQLIHLPPLQNPPLKEASDWIQLACPALVFQTHTDTHTCTHTHTHTHTHSHSHS